MINVTAIKLPESFDSYKKSEEEKAEFLEPVSKINIFVGSNNSGKSRFMRMLSSSLTYDVRQNTIDLTETNLMISGILEDLEAKMKLHAVIQINANNDGIDLHKINEAKSVINGELSLGFDRFGSIKETFNKIINSNAGKFQLIGEKGELKYDWVDQVKEHIKNQSERIITLVDSIPIQSVANAPNKVYIPTLRGLRPIDNSKADLYSERTILDYFKENAPEIFTGLTLYKQILELKNGEYSERKSISNYEKFISESLFENKDIELIAKPKFGIVFVRIGNEAERPIYDLGDGIQSAIILSFLPFMMQEQTFFFIEEPEMYLHPGLQRKLLDFYSSLERHTFFLTTHSNHFLDITIDIKDVSIFTFRKVLGETDEDELTPDFTIEAVDSGHESSLELLGVRNSSVFLVNATIWVEGITDRWCLREMLKSYMNYLKDQNKLKLWLEEDTHYSFVEYGGANITHWSFLDYEEKPIEVKRLCAKSVVIIDEDGKKKEQRKEDLEKFLGERLIILPCREVENLLPYEVIKEVVAEYEKNDELKMPEFAYEKYKDKYLGTFIESQMLKNKSTRKGGYKADSGTIKSKVDFCEKALPKIKFENLPDSTKEIIERIYEFIYKQNSK